MAQKRDRTWELTRLLDRIGMYQKKMADSRGYYRSLVREFDLAMQHQINPQDREELQQEIAALGREFEEKRDLLASQLGDVLCRGLQLAEKMGQRVSHDYKLFWQYMTGPLKGEVELDHVLRDIEHLKRDLL